MYRKTAIFACLLAALVSVAIAAFPPYTNCGDPSKGRIISVQVDPCPAYTAPNNRGNGCNLQRATNVTFTMVFEPLVDFPHLGHKVYGKFMGVSVPFPGIGPPNACPNAGLVQDCSLQAGTEYVYTNRFQILRSYPRIAVDIKYMLNSGDDNIVCFELLSKLV